MVTTSKINAPSPINTLKTSSTQAKEKNSTKFNAKESHSTAPTGETYQTFSVTALSSLFFDDNHRQSNQKKVVVYGNDLLDQLDKIRISLVAGTIPKDDLIQLIKILENRPQLEIDPDLENLIREIETRAAVELAKLGV
ncbi:flagellar assembly protein FliX [Candidatus Odyssella acanthamoebae]|uniref:flagellar assembly protein FliX n=1 Tax=Candidatus Odyssella acanthamoebae TaxID=91604 RepID=UPI00068EB608|nr:flagellar assembly protein FliX [Candidatus Paracaedibacter acanthamoebae]